MTTSITKFQKFNYISIQDNIESMVFVTYNVLIDMLDVNICPELLRLINEKDSDEQHDILKEIHTDAANTHSQYDFKDAYELYGIHNDIIGKYYILYNAQNNRY